MEMNNDPRYVRVRGQLREAGVSRTTFYQHGDCPAQFIADMVVDVLQPYLDDLIGAVASPNENYLLRWRDTYVRMLAELRVHRGFLSALFTPTQPVVVGHITRRLTPTFDSYVAEFKSHLKEETVSDLRTAMATTQQVYNLIAVLVAWLGTDMKESPDVVVNTYLSLAPPASSRASRPTAPSRYAACAPSLTSRRAHASAGCSLEGGRQRCPVRADYRRPPDVGCVTGRRLDTGWAAD